ncbi:5-hydroxytryptamine receptor 1E-like [Rhopilema esculentum]|uniref:5-hydroxytryptamine receptor 1E-like n=1 Tax=Rhopilema esculentum TaxID=499914 RepID=UPI0031D34EBC
MVQIYRMQNTSLNETVRCSTGLPFPWPNSGKFYASTITEIVFLISTSAFSSILNAVIVVSLVRKEQLRTPANLILTSMAVSDFLVGFLSEPIAVTRRIFDIYGYPSCLLQKINLFLGSSCVPVSFINITIFALDRCFATVFPYRYIRYVTYKKYLILVLLVWIAIVLLALLSSFTVVTHGSVQLIYSFLFLTSLVLCFISYIVIYRTIRSLTKRTATVAIAESIPRNRDLKLVDKGVPHNLNQDATSKIERFEISVVNNEEGGSPAAITTNIRNLKGEKSRCWTAFILLSVFYLSYLPHFILGRVFERVQVDETSKYIARFWTINIIFLNSSLNPIIYCVRVQDIRLQLKATVAACFSLVRPAGELY